MRSFIEFNIERRKAANSEFESNNLKMANNALYGKTIENMFKRRKVRLVNSSEKLLKFANLHFKGWSYSTQKLQQWN